ncbi:glyoxalase-like domain protein [cyanobacterium endosymbiont of Epithemia turgida]|uniref:glyoxalase-like domain protein n=1 Tax=cyanobacterium endosymbiont of Epithemia turgida TaxID=718217 RepID=UPI0004D16F62|nr:glyoxalase-like domain protein [cyanobacterium endosymbiont of Epithemia turgida]BAP17165.1 hypothetical protein ETSB_0291 [cyanobacterium endosymbiont of Epithemia turgida isolate EtSB Lake Yunoko]
MDLETNFSLHHYYLGMFLPIDSLFSTQGIMVMLLASYGLTMWMFLTSAPKIYTIMVCDLEIARQFYQGLLELPVAEVPLHYYYNYEQNLGTEALDSFYVSTTHNPTTAVFSNSEGLWYQLKKNAQLHIIAGASYGHKNRQRHVCFDHECLEDILLRVQSRRLKYKIRRNQPLNFLVKDIEERIIEITEIDN